MRVYTYVYITCGAHARVCDGMYHVYTYVCTCMLKRYTMTNGTNYTLLHNQKS